MTVAKSMIEKGTITFKKKEMNISKYDNKQQNQLSDLEGIIEVTDIPSNMKKDMLVMIFENTKRHGGGPITNVEFNNRDTSALIQFVNPKGIIY